MCIHSVSLSSFQENNKGKNNISLPPMREPREKIFLPSNLVQALYFFSFLFLGKFPISFYCHLIRDHTALLQPVRCIKGWMWKRHWDGRMAAPMRWQNASWTHRLEKQEGCQLTGTMLIAVHGHNSEIDLSVCSRPAKLIKHLLIM